MLKVFFSVPMMVFFVPIASAQDFSPIPNMNTVDYNLPQYATQEVLKDAVNRRERPVSDEIENDAHYIVSLNRTRQNLANFVGKTRAIDPEGAEKMNEMFASTDVIRAISDAMAGLGLRHDNAADAFAIYWVAAWQAANGELTDRSPATYQSVANQAARGLSASPNFANASDAQKQEMAEALMVQTVMIDAAKDAYSSNAVQLKALSKAVSQGAAASGLDLDKMTLTEDGFVPTKPRKKADASDAVGDDATALASADTGGTSGDSSTPNYALIAGAAGAGLGAAFLIGKAMAKKG